MSGNEEFEIDVGEVGDKQQWHTLPSRLHGRRDVRRLVSDIVDLVLNSANVAYVRVRRTTQCPPEADKKADE